MADTAALRRKLENRIAALHAELQEAEADLKAVDRVERIEADLAAKTGDRTVVPPIPQIVRRQPVLPETPEEPTDKPTVIMVCEGIARSAPDVEFTVGTMTPQVRRYRPDAQPENVAVSMARLANRGVLRKIRKDPKLGNIYVLA